LDVERLVLPAGWPVIAMDMRDEWLTALRAWARDNASVRELWLFGSRAKGTSRPKSDVDLALALMPPTDNHDWALGNYYAFDREWKQQLEHIVGRDVSLEPMPPNSDTDAMVRKTGKLLWSRSELDPRLT
jgi:predicted nucleotidyltransferase